jgi:hypothetical protein
MYRSARKSDLMDQSNPPQAVVHNLTIIDWAFGEEQQNGRLSERRNGVTAEKQSSCSNGYLSTSFMVHGDDDVTLIIYNRQADRACGS